MMKIRKLVYEEKTSIDDFGIRDVGSLNELIYGEWLLTRKELRGDDRCILKVFNDTYYICTLALVKPDVRLQISYVLNEIEMPSVVIPLTRFYLSRLEQLPKTTRWFRNSMEAVMEADWEVNQDSLKEIVSNDSSIITSDLFAPRVLTEELMSGLSEIEWRNATNGYEKDKIQMIVTALAKNKDVWQKMVETIKAAAQKYDYDYGFEDLVDDNGNVVYEFDINDNPNRIKVPKDPYDCEGNEILEPLKRAGVYQFCDELKERYEELVLEAQPTEDKNGSTKTKDQLVDITWNDKSTNMRKSKVIDKLPDVLNIDIARSIFSKCIMNGWIKDTESGFHWLGLKNCRGRIAQLAYLCGKIYGFEYDKVSGNKGSEFPDEALCKLFNEKYIEKQLVQAYSAVKPQKWRAIIDELFE